MEEKFKNLSDVFGNLSKVEENPKSIKKKDETFMMDLLEHLCQIEAVSAVVRTIGIQADKYENPFYKSIKLLMQKHYGDMKTEIILWWVFDSLTPEGNVYPLVDEDGTKHILKTPQQLYKFLKKYDGK